MVKIKDKMNHTKAYKLKKITAHIHKNKKYLM
jgi:hypothetical protein